MTATAQGRLITLEGGEGAGKSFQASRLAATLAELGQPTLQTREPGGSAGAEAIRALLLAPTPLDEPWDVLAEALLHFAARRQHVVRTIRPTLAAGRWVISDRFVDSTLAYQGFGQGLPRSTLDALAAMTLDEVTPDLTLVLDIPPASGLKRAAARGAADRYERLGLDVHERIRQGFLAIAAAAPERCVVIDATAAPDAVAAAIAAAVRRRFGMPA